MKKKNILFVHEVASQAEILWNFIYNIDSIYNIKRILYFNHKYYKKSEINNLYDANLDINIYKKWLIWKIKIWL